MTGMLAEDADFTLRTEKSAPQFSDNNRHTRDAMKAMTGARDDAMTGNGGTRDGRDGRRQDMLAGLSVVAAVHVKTTGGVLARRGVLVSAGVCARPPTMQKTTGGAETSPVMDMLAGLCVVAAIHVKMTGGALARRDGALRLSEVGSEHGQYEGIGNPTAQPQQMASATVWASKRASVCTRIAAVDAEMARCDSAEDR